MFLFCFPGPRTARNAWHEDDVWRLMFGADERKPYSGTAAIAAEPYRVELAVDHKMPPFAVARLGGP